MAFLSPLTTSRAPGPYLTTPEPLDKPSSTYYTLTTFFNYPKGKASLPLLTTPATLTTTTTSATFSISSPSPPHLTSHLTSFFISPLFSSAGAVRLITSPPPSAHQLPLFIPTFPPRPPPSSLCHAIISFFSLHSAVFFLLSFCLP